LARYVAQVAETRELWWVIFWKSSLLRPERRWEDSIKMGVRETDYSKWFELSQGHIHWRVLVLAVLKYHSATKEFVKTATPGCRLSKLNCSLSVKL
jgi:hypothetical protein